MWVIFVAVAFLDTFLVPYWRSSARLLLKIEFLYSL